MAFLDNTGLAHLWSKIVNLFDKRIEVSETAPTEEENKIWLQPMITNVAAVDYIVDEGVSGIWTYRKWNSGIAECWGQVNYVLSSNISANDYDTPTVSLPFTFVSRFSALITPAAGAWQIGRHYDLTDDSHRLNYVTVCYWPVVDMSSGSHIGFMTSIKGTWK